MCDLEYYTYEEVADEFSVVSPNVWKRHSLTEKARLVSTVWTRDYLPILKIIIELRKEKLAEEKARKEELRKAKILKKRKYHAEMSDLVYKVLNYYGDCSYELAIQKWGENGPEMMCSGAKELNSEDEDCLFGEAFFAAFSGNEKVIDRFDEIRNYWTKYHR